MRKGDNDGPVLTKLEVVCNDIVGVLLDLVLIVSVLDATEVPGDNIRPRTRHNSLLRFVHAGVETRRCEGDDLSHCSNVLRLEMQLDCLGLRKTKSMKKKPVSMVTNTENYPSILNNNTQHTLFLAGKLASNPSFLFSGLRTSIKSK